MSIKFDEKVSQSINKKRQIPLSIKSKICVITTEDGKNYSIKAGVDGWVVDFNMELDKDNDLLQKKVLKMLIKKFLYFTFFY